MPAAWDGDRPSCEAANHRRAKVPTVYRSCPEKHRHHTGGVALEDAGPLGLDSGEGLLGLLRVSHAQLRARDFQKYDVG